MAYQNLFEALRNVCGFTALESDMFQIIDAYEKDKAVISRFDMDTRKWIQEIISNELEYCFADCSQDNIDKWVEILERYAEQKLNIHSVMQAEGPDGAQGAAVASEGMEEANMCACKNVIDAYNFGGTYYCIDCKNPIK